MKGKKTKQVRQRQSLSTFHRQTDAQRVPKQKMSNFPKPPLSPFYG